MTLVNPLVSIVIPCYNGAEYVGAAIASALEQTYRAIEVIVIDDGSTDETPDVLRSFGGAITWRSGVNRGGAAARNRGLSMCNGEYIQFLDADDTLAPTKVEDALRQGDSSAGDALSCLFQVSKRDGTSNVCGPLKVPHDDSFVWFLQNDIRICPLYRRESVAAVDGFDEHLPCCQDFDLNMRLALAGGRFVVVPSVGYHVRRRAGSTSSDEVRLYRVMVNVLVRAQAAHGHSWTVRRHAVVAERLTQAGRWLLRFGDVEGGLYALGAAEALHRPGASRAYSKPALCIKALLGPLAAERVLWFGRRLRRALPARG